MSTKPRSASDGTLARWLPLNRPLHGQLALSVAVNRFNQACGLDQRVRADSHIALHEAFPAPDAINRLDTLYRQMLATFLPA